MHPDFAALNSTVGTEEGLWVAEDLIPWRSVLLARSKSLCALPQDPEGEAQQQVVRPVCVALIDRTGTEGYMELVRCSVLAALEALPPCTEFGLATFSDKASILVPSFDTTCAVNGSELVRCAVLAASESRHHAQTTGHFHSQLRGWRCTSEMALNG